MATQDFLSRFPKTTGLLNSAKRDVFPAYAVGVYLGSAAQGDSQTYLGYAGCGARSLFDLASLTKVLSTTTLMAIAEDKKVISTDTPVTKFFPNFPSPEVRLSHLLNHSSGLPAWLPLHALFHSESGLGQFNPRFTPEEARERYETEILKSWKPEGFEKETVYSDLGFMLLGWALEKATAISLDALFQEWIAIPNSLASLQFLPTSPDVVPTENCPWRGHVLHGEVHDDNCFVLGGVAGHAGLFGTVDHVLKLARLWLEAFQGRESLISTEAARKYWIFTHVPNSSRTLGWDGVSPEGSSTGHYFSRGSRGHLGFTGTSLWIDPEKNLIVSLLTNRVHPTRTNEKIKAFRPIFHDTLLQELGVAREPKRDA